MVLTKMAALLVLATVGPCLLHLAGSEPDVGEAALPGAIPSPAEAPVLAPDARRRDPALPEGERTRETAPVIDLAFPAPESLFARSVLHAEDAPSWRSLDVRTGAHRLDLEEEELFPGLTVPLRSVLLGASVEAAVAAVEVHDGATVEEGDVLVRLHDEVAQATLRVAEAAAARRAALEMAQEEVTLSRNYLGRLEGAKVKGATSEVKIEEARTRLRKAEALVRAEREKLEEAARVVEEQRARIEHHTLVAPFDGVIWDCRAEVGAMAGPGSELLALHDLSALRVTLHVPLRLHGRLEVGERYLVQARAPLDRALPAMVVATDPIVDAKTGTFRVLFELPNPDGTLPAGMAVVFAGTPAD